MWSVLLGAILLLITRTHGVDPRVDPLVLTNQGLVRGVRSSDGTYNSFLGIPFARVDPENPFGVALPAPTFNEVYEAKEESPMCPQRNMFSNTMQGSLDCLQINVFVPALASSANRLPVMVWTYGGGFEGGYSSISQMGPEDIVRHDVILVTYNYRVGPYGFMCLDIPGVPGNAGLKDQQLALRWVKENIAAFGGDVNSITAFGQSAGGMSIGLQILSPGSNGLFHRAIIQSGSPLVEQLIVHSRPSDPIEMAKYLGFDVESVERALYILKEVPSDDVIRAGKDLGLTFKPCIEQTFEDVPSFMIDYPDITLASGNYESVPVIIGFTSNEQLGRYINKDNFDDVQQIFYERINGSFAFESEEQLRIAADIVKQFYIGAEAVSRSVYYELGDFDSDVHFAHPIDRSVLYHLATSEKPIYQYMFAYSGGVSNNMQPNTGYATHGDELAYIFTSDKSTNKSIDDKTMTDWITTMWTNFAKFGDPTPETNGLLPVRWPAVTRDSREYLFIDSNLAVDKKPVYDRIAFWDLFFAAFCKYYRMVWD